MENESIREVFGRALVEIGKKDDKVVVVDADISASTKTDYFKKAFPGRFVDVGIAEQNLLGVSAGLAASGLKVFSSSFAVFQTGRGFEVIRNMICIANLDVKLCSTHAGLMTGEDGGTHQSIEDISIMRTLPNMTVLVPADAAETIQMIEFMSKNYGPTYLRLVKDNLEDVNGDEYKFELGKANIIKEGQDISIIACGPMVKKAVLASEILKENGIDATVVNMSTIKPIDIGVIISCAKNSTPIITVEDHSIIGGLGSAVSEVVCENCPTKVIKLGVNDRFGESGSSTELYEEFGLTVENIVKTAYKILQG